MRKLLAKLRKAHGAIMLAAVLFAASLADRAGIGTPDALQFTPDGRPIATQLAVVNIWVQIAIMIVAALVSYALTPKPPVPKPAALEDFDVPTAEEGRPIPVVFGDVWIKGPNCLWFGDLRSQPIRSKGGKK